MFFFTLNGLLHHLRHLYLNAANLENYQLFSMDLNSLTVCYRVHLIYINSYRLMDEIKWINNFMFSNAKCIFMKALVICKNLKEFFK